MSAVRGEFLFEGLDRHRGPAPLAGVVVSGALHLLVLSLAWGVAGELREAERREARERAALEETARSAERRLIWYPERKRVPEVSPAKPFGPAKTPQGQRSRETLIAQSDNPESKRQFVYRPSRPERLKSDVEAANLVAAPEDLARQAAPELPQVQKTQRARREFEGLREPARKSTPPAEVAVAEDLLRAAEGLRDAEAEAKGAAGLKAGKVAKPLRQFDARSLEGARPRGVQAGEIGVSEEVLRAAEGIRNTGAEARGVAGLRAGNVAKPAARKFEGLPQGRGAGGPGGGTGGSQLVSAPEIAGETVAVISLNPGPRTVLPEGSRPGQFARAPVEGEPSSGTGGSGVKVPGLMAKGSPAEANGAATEAAASAAMVPDRKKMQELAVPPVARTISAPLRSGARVVPQLVESVFSGRNVYTLVVPDVKMPGYRGDWIIWFGGREASEGRMAAPYPSAKMLVDGASAASTDGTREAFVQFGAVIGPDGKLSKVRILRTRAEDAVKTRALLELQTWAFRPATINGQAIEVDAVIEVTFVF